MKRFTLALLTTAALAGPTFAADVPATRAAPAQAAAVMNWTGFYVGAHVGYGRAEIDAQSGIPVGIDPRGWLGGAQLGFDYQFGTGLVAGVVADVSAGGLNGRTTVGAIAIPAEIDLSGTVRAKLGYAAGALLVYGTGGLAWARSDVSIAATGLNAEATQFGWVAGAGIEWLFARNWSLGLEYLWLDYGQDNYCFTVGLCVPFQATSQQGRVAINYRF